MVGDTFCPLWADSPSEPCTHNLPSPYPAPRNTHRWLRTAVSSQTPEPGQSPSPLPRIPCRHAQCWWLSSPPGSPSPLPRGHRHPRAPPPPATVPALGQPGPAGTAPLARGPSPPGGLSSGGSRPTSWRTSQPRRPRSPVWRGQRLPPAFLLRKTWDPALNGHVLPGGPTRTLTRRRAGRAEGASSCWGISSPGFTGQAVVSEGAGSAVGEGRGESLVVRASVVCPSGSRPVTWPKSARLGPFPGLGPTSSDPGQPLSSSLCWGLGQWEGASSTLARG